MSKTTETFEKSKDFMSQQMANGEKMAESFIELGATMFQNSDAFTRKMYENYVTNTAATFDGLKALTKTDDVSDFVKVATNNASSASERLSEQTKSVMELGGKLVRETGEATVKAYTKSFKA
ncbi:MAG: phasin family protein [Pseudomonadota bacterium]